MHPNLNKVMKKTLFFALVALVCVACGKNDRLLTSATGSIYECLVVAPSGEVSQAVSQTMGADLYGLPQMEPVFSVSSVVMVSKVRKNVQSYQTVQLQYVQLAVCQSYLNKAA